MPSRSKSLIPLACSLVLAQALASFILPQSYGLMALSDLTQCALLILGFISLLPNIAVNRGAPRLFWMLMALGVASWLSYQLLWTYFEVVLHRPVPDIFAGDIVLALHLVPMIAAVALQPHTQRDNRTARLGTLDFSLLLVWWVYLYVFAVIPWGFVHPDEPAYSRNLNALYLTEKIVLLGGLVLLRFRSKGGWRAIYFHLFAASILYGASSYLANWAIERNIYYSGSLYDVPMVIAMAWLSVAGVVALRRSPQPEPAKLASHGVWVARLGLACIFSLPIFAGWALFDIRVPHAVRNFRLVLTLGTMLVMCIQVFLKQHLLDRELLRLLNESENAVLSLKKLQAQLVQSEKLASLGQLVGGAAHELNNPLTALLGYFELLESTTLTGEQRTLAEKIGQQARRTRTLVSGLLSFAKQVPTEKTPLDVNALAQTAVKLSQPQLHARGIDVITDWGAGLPSIWADPNQLLQVCLHVINNALQAMTEKGGTLIVRTHGAGASVGIEFADTGPGMEFPERVFDPFYTTRPIGQGTGLGLSACYGIVQEHHGRIVAQNRPEGGALFTIELPAMAKALPRPDQVHPKKLAAYQA